MTVATNALQFDNNHDKKFNQILNIIKFADTYLVLKPKTLNLMY